MNLQRREEIRKMCADPARGGTQGAKQIFDLRDAVNELFAHIDTLEQTAAERVIADGGRGPTPDYTGEGSAWVPPVEAPAVVVPKIPKFDPAWELSYRGKIASEKEQQAFANGYQFAMHKAEEAFKNACAIPADRVLGEGNQFGVGFVEACGMLAAKPFDRPTLAAGLIREGGTISALAETPSDGLGISILREEMRADLDALRVNQGGV